MLYDGDGGCSMSNLSHEDEDVRTIAAALADALAAGGLSKEYYRKADDVLENLSAKVDELRAGLWEMMSENAFYRFVIEGSEKQLASAIKWRNATPWPRCSDAESAAKERARIRAMIKDLRFLRTLAEGGA